MRTSFSQKVLFLYIITVIQGCCQCNKSDCDPPAAPIEKQLTIEVQPDPGNGFAVSLGSRYDFILKITSEIPSSGVSIKIRSVKDGQTVEAYGIKSNSNNTSNQISVVNLTENDIYNITCKVQSLSQTSNTANKTFKVAWK